jgi:CheY-like chemotaxis protein
VAAETVPGSPPTAGAGLVRLSVTDDGAGVPDDVVDQLFVPFFTTKPPGSGSGLGLPVSFGIAAAHGGRLRYEPAPGGRGARFVLELPVAVTADPAPVRTFPATPAPPAGPPARQLSVLVVDDEPSIVRLIEKALTLHGARVATAGTGTEAIAQVEAAPFDVVLCDHRMPGMSGTVVHEHVVARRPELRSRFVLMSGDVFNAELADFVSEHGVRLVEKPLTIEMIIGVVGEIAAAPAAGA